MSADAFGNGLMNVVKGINSPKFKFDASILHNGKFSVAVLGNDGKKVYSSNNGIYRVAEAMHNLLPNGLHKITFFHFNGGHAGYTVDMVRSILGIHEYYGHAILGLDNSKESHAIIKSLVEEYLLDPNR